MSNYDTIRDFVASCASMLYFQYKGKEGHVDPCYSKAKGYSYLLWYDGDETTVHSVDEVMNTPFWDGKPLADIADDVTDITW